MPYYKKTDVTAIIQLPSNELMGWNNSVTVRTVPSADDVLWATTLSDLLKIDDKGNTKASVSMTELLYKMCCQFITEWTIPNEDDSGILPITEDNIRFVLVGVDFTAVADHLKPVLSQIFEAKTTNKTFSEAEPNKTITIEQKKK